MRRDTRYTQRFDRRRTIPCRADALLRSSQVVAEACDLLNIRSRDRGHPTAVATVVTTEAVMRDTDAVAAIGLNLRLWTMFASTLPSICSSSRLRESSATRTLLLAGRSCRLGVDVIAATLQRAPR